jgi:DNA transformation protein and related proteins
MRPDDLSDLFRSVDAFRSRRMFGGYGLYDGPVIIGLILDDTLYLKTDAQSAPHFVGAGARPFVYSHAGGKPVTMPYHTIPEEAFDDPDEAERWIALALAAGHRSKAAPKRRAASRAQ